MCLTLKFPRFQCLPFKRQQRSVYDCKGYVDEADKVPAAKKQTVIPLALRPPRWARFKANFLPPLKSPLVSLGTLDLKELVKVRVSNSTEHIG